MAPRTRTRNTKVLKENVDVVRKTTKVKSNGKVTKPPRKALADKTNSLSDDNASIDVPIKTSKAVLKNKAANTNKEVRPRRDRRLPNRYVENQVLSNLSNNKDGSFKNQPAEIVIPDSSPQKREKPEVNNIVTSHRKNDRLQPVKEPPATKKSNTPTKQNTNVSSSPFKTPTQSLDSILVPNRPKRICRLPSKFEDHSISPNKFIPVEPSHASTPIIQKNPKPKINGSHNEYNTKLSPEKRMTRKAKNNEMKKNNEKEGKNTKGIEHYFSKIDQSKRTIKSKDISSSSINKISPDSNNNKGKKILPKRVVSTKSPKTQLSPKSTIKVGFTKRILDNNLSFRVFEDRKAVDKDQDVYEFTFDPNEEPKPQKKKRKRVVRKKPAIPKTVVIKNNYDKNVQKALESLKNKVKPSQSQITNKPTEPVDTTKPQTQIKQQQNIPTVTKNAGKIQIIEDIIIKPPENKSLNHTPAHPANESAKSIHMSNYASIHVEDIAADFEVNDSNNLNYSPVYSPCPTPRDHTENAVNQSYGSINPKDPLNLQGNVSFFDEQPVASSSMNMSVRHPLASPWRVEFNNLPIKWQANTYVKANMTPAVESSFITSEEISKKKHVYTDMVADEPLPLMEEPPSLKQTSIISFMKEVAERSLKKKKKRSVSPTKANSLFEDTVGDTSNGFGFKTAKKPRKEPLSTPNVSNSSNKSSEKENENHIENEHPNEVSNENSNPEENSNQSKKSPKKKSKKKNKDGTFFGFDDSENIDQENVSPIKNMRHTRARGLRAKSGVLQEINTLSGPTRAVLPVTAKAKLASAEVVEKLYDQLKSAEVAPVFPEKQKNDDKDTAANDETISDDDGESVHLFEDIELIHHIKPQRKSYGKAKKVTFRHSTDSDTYTEVPETRSSDAEDLGDLTFQMPNVKQKKVTKKKKPKKQLSKKEEKEADEWAAGFNSMCEDIDEFPLVVE